MRLSGNVRLAAKIRFDPFYILTNPGSTFKSPKLLVEAQQISYEDELRILECWKPQLIQRQRATDENMPPPDIKLGVIGDEIQQVDDAFNAFKR